MAVTKALQRTRTLQFAEAISGGVTSQRWDVTANGEVDQIIGRVEDREWRLLLTANPYLKFATVTSTSDATTGRYTKASLTTGAGDTQQRFYRVLWFSVGNVVFEQVDAKDWALAEQQGSSGYIWWEEGDNLFALPKATSTVATIAVNWIPARQDQLAGESSTINFPDGFEDVVALESAARMLSKGGAESDAAQELRGDAEVLRREMTEALVRPSLRGRRVGASDTSDMWAGT